MPTPTIALSPEQIASYHVNGFLSLDAITTAEEVAELREIYDDVFTRQVGRERGDQFDLGGSDEEGVKAKLPQILGPSKYAPRMRETLAYANARAVAEQLLGGPVESGGDHAINKPAHDGAETPWHQDEAYWNPKLLYQKLSIWIPLQPATMDNGCMQFIPWSHQLDIVPHRSIGGDVRVHGLEICEPSASYGEAVACPIPAGGATVHHNRTMHYAGPNGSDQPRRAWIIGFQLPARPYPIERRFPWEEAKRTARLARAEAARQA